MKKKVIILFGGKSIEHEVSVNSALSIEKNIDRSIFLTSVIGIAHNGSWNYGEKISDIVKGGKVVSTNEFPLPKNEIIQQILSADTIFSVIHGPNGEDGTIQGLLELANVPYVGSGVLASAICLDKVLQKQLCANAEIPQTNFLYFSFSDWVENNKEVIYKINQLKFPLFVKPANTGSSVGISNVNSEKNLAKAIVEAFNFDNKVIVEEAVNNIIEVQVSIFGNNILKSSICGSIKPYAEFYDYETKYITNDIESKIPAEIPESVSEMIAEIARKAYKVLNCAGLARVDFFYQPHEAKIYLDEVNTIPGFTQISMYPKLWQATGIEYSELITLLINLAVDSWEQKQRLKHSYVTR